VLARVAGAVAVLYVAFLATVFAVMRQPPTRLGEIMRRVAMPALAIVPFERLWNVARRGDLRIGDPAPNFTLPRSDRSGDVTLSSLRGKPVVLVFGSYT